MAKILLGIALLFIAGAAYLGYAAKGRVDELQGNLKETKQNLASTKATLQKTEKDLTTRTEELAKANETIATHEKEIARQKEEITGLNTKLTEATAAVEAKTREVADLEMKLKTAMDATGGKKPEEFAAEINALKADVEKAKTELAEAKQVQATLEAQKKQADEKLAASERTVQEYKYNIVRAGLTGRILAYNPGWGFVVLSIGDKDGVKANTQMLVLRGNQPIAKVTVTSVEPQTSIADVIPGSAVGGAKIMPGDTVIYEAKR